MGKGSDPYNDFHILNTQDLSWEGRYFTLASPVVTSGGGDGLSGGAIAGIVVGAVAGVNS